MKVCIDCKKEFAPSRPWCKRCPPCQKKWRGRVRASKGAQDRCKRKYRESHKKLIADKQKVYRKEHIMKAYYKYKETLECIECGENHPACLDFHHRNPDDKKFIISREAPRIHVKNLMEEIEKCDVLCANCHKKLHWKEKHGEYIPK